MPPRTLLPDQKCQVWIHDTVTGDNSLLFETGELLLEAPNWTLDGHALVLNGDGVLWRMPLARPALHEIVISGVPPLNNDHVLHPDGKNIFLSAYNDWQLYRAPLAGGKAERITGKEGPAGLMHFLHGVAPDTSRLTFVGVEARDNGDGSLKFLKAQIYTITSDGRDYRAISPGDALSDGPEYSPDGAWIYFNTEAFSKNAQIARMRPDGSGLERLSHADTVDWFPHLCADGSKVAYLAFPPGTEGHPADRWVELMLVRDGQWDKPMRAARLFGGQGTINVNSWSPDNRRFAYVAYPQKV
jgi:TolB protein